MTPALYRCFGRDEDSGNLAAVFSGAGVTAPTRLAQSQYPATVFIDTPAPGHARLDFYYPGRRSPLCLHASLAAAEWLFQQTPERTELMLESASSGVQFSALRVQAKTQLRLQTQQAPSVHVSRADLLRFFPVDGAELSVLGVYSVGSPKLLLRCASTARLEALNPDLAAILAWSEQHAVSGCYVVTELGEGSYQARNFNHREPAQEDHATGVAAAALALALGQNVAVRQGDRQGNPCQLHAHYRSDHVLLSGNCRRLKGA